MEEFEPNSLAGRVEKRLKKLGKKAAAVSVEATGKPDLVRSIFKAANENRAYAPNYRSITKLAGALRTTVQWLTEGTGPEEPGVFDAGTPIVSPGQQDGFGIIRAGIVEAGAFREVDPFSLPEDAQRIPLYPDPRYSRCRQAAWEVRGDSMVSARIFEGMWVIGALYDDYQSYNGDVTSGDFVVVQRSKAGGSEHEITVKEVRFFKDRFELIPHSTNSIHKPFVVPYSKKDDDVDEEIKILAVVIGTYNQF